MIKKKPLMFIGILLELSGTAALWALSNWYIALIIQVILWGHFLVTYSIDENRRSNTPRSLWELL